VGILELALAVPAHSLKEKRGVIKRIINRTQQKFNVSAAEVEHQDNPGSAILGFAAVGNDRRFINGVLDKIINHIDQMFLAEVVDHQIQIENY